MPCPLQKPKIVAVAFSLCMSFPWQSHVSTEALMFSVLKTKFYILFVVSLKRFLTSKGLIQSLFVFHCETNSGSRILLS